MDCNIFESRKINNKELWKTKQTSKCEKTQRSCSKIVTFLIFHHFKWWNMKLYKRAIKVWHLGEAQNFRIEKNKQHGIMEDRMSFQKQKPTTF